MKYDADYFIAKFKAIPDSLFCTNTFQEGERRCARGHCGESNVSMTDESRSLISLGNQTIGNGYEVAEINDGEHAKYKQPTPKQRVLAWLRDAKEAGL